MQDPHKPVLPKPGAMMSDDEFNTRCVRFLKCIGILVILIALILASYSLIMELHTTYAPIKNKELMERLYNVCITKGDTTATNCADNAKRMARDSILPF